MKLLIVVVILIKFQKIKNQIPEIKDDFYTPSFPLKAFEFIYEQIDCNGTKNINFYVNHTETGNQLNIDNLLRIFSNSTTIYVKTFQGELSKLKDSKNLIKSSKVHVFLAQNTEKAENVVQLINKRVYTKYYQKYFLIIQEAFIEDLNWLEKIFQDFLKKEVLNVVVIFSNSGKMYSFTYNPYTPDGFKLINLMGKYCETEYFYEKLFNLYGHRLTISMLTDNIKSVKSKNGKYKGTDGYLAETIEQR